jgi:preprotein translocase subunit YajC
MYLLNIIFPEAYAQAAPGIAQGLDLMSFAPLVVLFAALYFIVIRPQTKKAKEHREMLSALRRGDQIVTSGGILGTITKLENDNEVIVEISDNVNVRVVRSMITHVLTKPQPLNTKDSATPEARLKSKKPTVAILKNNQQKAKPQKSVVKKEKK